MILIAGASGQLGGLIARSLLQNREPVRVLARRGPDPHELVEAGAQTVIAWPARDRKRTAHRAGGLRLAPGYDRAGRGLSDHPDDPRRLRPQLHRGRPAGFGDRRTRKT